MEPNQNTDPRILSIFGQLDNSVQNLTRRLEAMQARDLDREFVNGQFYKDGQEPSRILKAETVNVIPGVNTNAQVFVSNLDVQEILINYLGFISSGNSLYHMRVAYDSDPLFKNVPADFSRRCLFVPPSQLYLHTFTVATGAQAAMANTWSVRLKLPFRCISLNLLNNVANLTTLANWETRPVSVTFFGK